MKKTTIGLLAVAFILLCLYVLGQNKKLEEQESTVTPKLQKQDASAKSAPQNNSVLPKDRDELQTFIDNAISAGDASIPKLREMLAGNDQDARELAAVTLAHIGSPEAVKTLTQAIKDATGDEKNNLLQLVGLLESSDSLQPLIGELLDANADPELNGTIRKSLRIRKNPELVPELVKALQSTSNKKEETQVGIVIQGLKEDVNTPYLVSSAVKQENNHYIQYMFGGLSSIGSQRSIEGIFKVADQYPDDKFIQAEALKAFGFTDNARKIEYLGNILLSTYKPQTKQIALLAFENDNTHKAANILNQILPQVSDQLLKDNILTTINKLPAQPDRK